MKHLRALILVILVGTLTLSVSCSSLKRNLAQQPMSDFFVFEQKILLINQTTFTVYAREGQDYRLAQTIPLPETSVTSVQVFSSNLLALMDEKNVVFIYEDDGKGLKLDRKESLPPNTVIDILDKQGLTLLGENKNHQSPSIRLMNSKKVTMEELAYKQSQEDISSVRICPDNTAIIQFQSSIHFYNVQNQILNLTKTINLPEKIEDLTINKYCTALALSYENSLGVIEVLLKVNGQFSEKQKIQVSTKFHPKIVFDITGNLLAIQGQHDFFVYRKSQASQFFGLEKVIKKRNQEMLLGIQEQEILLRENNNLFSISIKEEKRKSLILEERQKVRVERQLNSESVTSNFGGKINFVYETQTPLSEATRQIMEMRASGDLMIATSKFQNVLLYEKEGTSFSWVKNLTQTIFMADIDIETGEIAIAAHKNAYIYEGPTFDLSQTIPTESQVRRIDLTIGGWLLLGHSNGTISIYTSNGANYEWQNKIDHAGGSVYGLRKCSDGNIITIMEEEGAFSIRIYDDTLQQIFRFDIDELIEVFMDITEDCQTIAVSGITMREVLVYRHYGSIFYFFEGIEDEEPLGPVSVHNDGDLILVPRLTSKETLFYRYVSCGGYFVLDSTFTSDDYFSATALTPGTILMGKQNGEILVESYTWQAAGSVDFGGKGTLTITEYTTTKLPRLVKGLSLSGNYLAVNVEYTNGYLFKNNGEDFTQLNDKVSQSIFLSDVDIADLINFMVLGSHDTRTFILSNKGMGYDLSQTIISDSQVEGVDLSPDGTLLLGHKNGNLTFYRYDGQQFEYVASMIHSESAILDTIICPDSLMLALVEYNGLFYLRTYTVDTEFTQFQQVWLENQFMKPFFSATDDCKLVAISGTMMMGAEIHIQQEDLSYVPFKTIENEELLADISIEKDGDLIMVSRLLTKESILYKYSKCDDEYIKEATLPSASYDVASDLNCQFIVQGDEKGGIIISQYTYDTVVCDP